MNKQAKKTGEKKEVTIYLSMFNYWGDGGSTQYKYSKKELFYLTQGR